VQEVVPCLPACSQGEGGPSFAHKGISEGPYDPPGGLTSLRWVDLLKCSGKWT
jgi:hypothetical protein